MKVIRKVSKKELKDFLYDLPLEDENLYKEMNDENSFGIFQFSANLASRLVKEIKPSSFEEAVAINSLARPGTSSFTDDYIDGRDKGKKRYPDVIHNLLSSTNGIILFQEQVMQIFNKIGGFTLEETNFIRGLMKKLGKLEKDEKDVKAWDKVVKRFIKESQKKGLKKEEAEFVANDLLQLSSYSFNRCFSGDMRIDRDNKARWSPTIEEMYLTKNDKKWAYDNGHKSLYEKYNREGYGKAFSLVEDKLFINEIVDIYYSGKQIVYEIALENGNKIEVTENHSFPTSNGEKTIKNGLSEGDYLFVNKGYKKETFNYNFSEFNYFDREFKNYEGEGFKEGENNSAFINGEFIKFKNNRKILLKESNGKCSLCGKKHKRLECHHLLGRKNNNKEDLIIVCPSCHKKMHYKEGRKRKNEKGKETALTKITSIKEIGMKNTYDVEMKAPYHTLSVNNIVAKNSHAVSYSYIGAITLYLSYYFKRYFYAATLEYDLDSSKDAFNHIKKIKNSGINIIPPEINNSEFSLSIKDNNIVFGFTNIKGIGEKAVAVILEKRLEGEFESFIDFIIRTRDRAVNSKVITSLIKAGMFDSFDNNRNKLLMKFEKFWKEKKSIKVEEKLLLLWNRIEKEINNIPGINTTTEDIISFEKELYGAAFFTSLFNDKINKAIFKLSSNGLIYSDLDDVGKVAKKTPILINNIRTHIDKNDNEMAFISGEDYTGDEISFPVFASYWKYLKEDLNINNIYLLSLYRQDNDEDSILFGSKKWINQENKIKRLINKF